MSNELYMSASLNASKNGVRVDSLAQGLSQDMTGANLTGKTQSIGFAADEVLDKGDVGTIGQLMVKNMDPTNYVELSTGTGGGFAAGKFAKLRPGAFCLLQPPGANVYAQANTAACDVFVVVVEL